VIAEVFKKKTQATPKDVIEVCQRRLRQHDDIVGGRKRTEMDQNKKDRLEGAGWRVGNAEDFLELTPEEAAFVELKLALARFLRDVRLRQGWTQAQTAKRLGSSQSRFAKMEAADASVSVDLLVKSLLGLGATREQVGEVIARAA
jgi:ribosome-binding protein aMBF1 (putative translation factor)